METGEARSSGNQLDPRIELSAWANEQDSWIRALVDLVLSGAAELSDAQENALYQHLLAEKRLSDSTFEEHPPVVAGSVSPEGQVAVRLRALYDVCGVNALAEGQRIEFADGMTVLFGQNAAGKTGYTRILKRAANVRRAEEILGNALEPDSVPPSARIDVSEDDVDRTIEWQNELGVYPLDRMSVFDARALDMHVDEEMGYVYTCLLYTSPSPRDRQKSRMPSSA